MRPNLQIYYVRVVKEGSPDQAVLVISPLAKITEHVLQHHIKNRLEHVYPNATHIEAYYVGGFLGPVTMEMTTLDEIMTNRDPLNLLKSERS